MRKPLCGTRSRRPWLLLTGAVFGCFAPLLLALGQAPGPDVPGSRAQFGTAGAVNDKKALPEMDAKKKKPGQGDKDGGVLLYAMPVTPPQPDLLFRLDSEEMFRERLRTEVRQRSPKIKLEFPDSGSLVPGVSGAQVWLGHVKWVEPSYVISKRLLFEQPRFERYGGDLGILQPAICTGLFGVDLFLWPARRMAQPFRCYQMNTDCYAPNFRWVGE